MLDAIGGLVGSAMSGVGDQVMNVLQSILYATIYKLFYYLGCGILKIVSFFNSMFEVMAGLSKVIYDGDGEYLINIFFSNTTVSKVYWGMALIGLVLAFAFAVIAVIRKLFDGAEKERRSYGVILGSLFKSILIILCMSALVTVVINSTNLLMQQINYVFNTGDALGQEQSITYSDEELAAMARVLNTIGNYSMNPSYDNRYNLNSCFNELRTDMQYLDQQGVFDFYYSTTDMEGNDIATWQSALQKIANSASLNEDLKMDVYYESVSTALLDTMELLRVNGSFKPLQSYERQYESTRQAVPLDRMLFLMSTMHAAKNSDYNRNPSIVDSLRAPYYYGEKSIYDLDSVNADFDIGIASTDYIILYLTAWKLLWSLATIILNCVARIFNILMLYLIAPPVVATMPLDDGGKFKQWLTAFIVQSLSVFGTVVAMRVILLFLPIIVDSKLLIFDNPIANLLAKLVIILGSFEVAEKATGIITGILADNAGWQSIAAGDMSQNASAAMKTGTSLALGAGKIGGKGAVTAAKYGAIGTGVAGAGALIGTGFAAYGVGKLGYEGGSALVKKIGETWRNSRDSKGEIPKAPPIPSSQIPNIDPKAVSSQSEPVTEKTLDSIKSGLKSTGSLNVGGDKNPSNLKQPPKSVLNMNQPGGNDLPPKQN